jgi:TonB family protein
MDAVLAHELAHVQRRDVLAQSIAQAACCLYWFHPLVWMALRELRREREHACDDAVLHSGVPAHAYASHLMELARDMAARRVWLADAPAMAGTSHLETRIRAMLSAGRNRNPLRRRAALSVAAIAAFAFLPLSSIYVFAQAGTGTITGIARDPSGARVPNCTVTAKNLDSANQETTTADNTGEYRLGVPSGRYVVSFAASGFKMQRREITLVAGALVQIDGNLEVGGISESVHVSVGPKITVPRSGSVKPPERIRIGGNVSMARLISQTKPFYPADVEAGLTGTVVLSAIIGKDGMIQNLKVVRSPDDRLARAVVEAVKQWRYEPTRLNGEPIEVITEIAVTFD